MIVSSTVSTVFHLALVLLAAGAAVQDVRTRQISNGWPLAILGLFLLAWLLGAIPGEILSHAMHFALALGAGMVLFALGWFGGGDAKLYAAIAIWFPLGAGLYLLTSVSLAGVAMAALFLGRSFFRAGDARGSTSIREGKIAYGLAIAAGTALSVGVPLLAGSGA